MTLKLKRADHRIITRRQSLREPTQLADTLYRRARALFDNVQDPGPFRLLGCGLSDLSNAEETEESGDLLDPQFGQRSEAERATDAIRERFGSDAIVKGRSLR